MRDSAEGATGNHGPGRKIPNVHQGDQTIEVYARDFVGVARQSATEEACLMVFFWGGLAEPFKSRMPYWHPEESLEGYVNLALSLSGSTFRMESPQSPLRPVSRQSPLQSPLRPVSRQSPLQSPLRPVSRQSPLQSPLRPVSRQSPLQSPLRPVSRQSPLQSPLRSGSPRSPLRSGSPAGPSVPGSTQSASVRSHAVRSVPGAPRSPAPVRETHRFRIHRVRSSPGSTRRSAPVREPTQIRSVPGAHGSPLPFLEPTPVGPGAHAFRLHDPGDHGVRLQSPLRSGSHQSPLQKPAPFGADRVRSRARSVPGAHAVRSRARSSPGATQTPLQSGSRRSPLRSGSPRSPLQSPLRSGSTQIPLLSPLQSGSPFSPLQSWTPAPVWEPTEPAPGPAPPWHPWCAHCSRPSSTPRAWPTSLLDIFLFSVCGASGIRSLKGGLCHGPAGVPRLATRCLCVLSTWLVVVGAMCSHVDCLSPPILLLNHCFSGSSCVSLVTLVCLPI